MKLQTRHFGEIEVDEDRIVEFAEGIPGFEGLRNFALFHDEDQEDDVFLWLQSLEDGDVAFVLLNTPVFIPGYDPQISEEEIYSLGNFTKEDIIIRNIAVVRDSLEDTTVNLRAPIVINASTRRGKQMVSLNETYHIRHYIFRELQEASEPAV